MGRRRRACRSWRARWSFRADAVEPDRAAHGRHLARSTQPAQEAVIAAAADERLYALFGLGDLEDEARIIIEVAPESGRDLEAQQVDAARLHEAVADLEPVDRRRDIELRIRREGVQRVGCGIGVILDAEEALEHRDLLGREARRL